MLLAQISDLHIKRPGALAYRRVDTGAYLARTVAALNALEPRPDAVIMTGDLVDQGDPEQYKHLKTLLAWRKSARFPVQVQAWLLAIVVMRTIAYLLGDHMAHAVGIDIAIPFDGFIQAVVAAALGIPYFRCSRRVQQTFVVA